MFLQKIMERNPELLEKAMELHAAGQVRPDTWVVDLDALLANAALILEEAHRHGIELYYMSKQYGRNPFISSKLQEIGYRGCVAVDFKEAAVLLNAGLRLGHVGHLVQIPRADVPKIVQAQPEIITVYSLRKAEEISKAALEEGRVQPIMLKMWDEEGPRYPGQEAGFNPVELKGLLQKLRKLEGVRVAGFTAFPCFLYDEEIEDFVPTANVDILSRARKQATRLPSPLQVNMPSATCVRTLRDIASLGGTHAEPGHGLTGTTPLHAATDQPEIPAMVYVTEVSHHWGRSSMVYGGGFYRRGMLKEALVEGKRTMVYPPDPVAIDYHFELNGRFSPGSVVLMAFRAQIFVTRSDVALVQGIHDKTKEPKLLGIYNSQGGLLGRSER